MKDTYDTLDQTLASKLRDTVSSDAPSWESFERYRAARASASSLGSGVASDSLSANESRATPDKQRSIWWTGRMLRRIGSVAAVVLLFAGAGYMFFSGQREITAPYDTNTKPFVAELQSDAAAHEAAGELDALDAEAMAAHSDVKIVR